MPETPPLPLTERTRHRRLREQGSTDRGDLAGILAAGVICHLGVVVDGYPMDGLALAEASVKIRSGPPDDGDSPDAALPVWAGVLPLAAAWQDPDPDPVLPAGIPLPPHIAALAPRSAG
jgi:hypothetical protein